MSTLRAAVRRNALRAVTVLSATGLLTAISAFAPADAAPAAGWTVTPSASAAWSCSAPVPGTSSRPWGG